MVESEDSVLDNFETTALVRINPKEATLPIDTSAEWTKGFMLVNKLIKELADVRYTESYIDDVGEARTRMVLHPQLLGYIQERRKMIDQIWKVSGGEVVNEGRKEAIKSMAKILFETQMERHTKEKYKKDVINILEVEDNDED